MSLISSTASTLACSSRSSRISSILPSREARRSASSRSRCEAMAETIHNHRQRAGEQYHRARAPARETQQQQQRARHESNGSIDRWRSHCSRPPSPFHPSIHPSIHRDRSTVRFSIHNVNSIGVDENKRDGCIVDWMLLSVSRITERLRSQQSNPFEMPSDSTHCVADHVDRWI